MSMFDQIYSKEPIECKCGNKLYDFQTKNFDNFLETYIVNEDGTIDAENYTLKEIPENERKDRFAFCKKELLGFYKMNYTGNIEMYTSCNSGKCWVNVYLEFVDGKVINKKIEISEME